MVFQTRIEAPLELTATSHPEKQPAKRLYDDGPSSEDPGPDLDFFLLRHFLRPERGLQGGLYL